MLLKQLPILPSHKVKTEKLINAFGVMSDGDTGFLYCIKRNEH